MKKFNQLFKITLGNLLLAFSVNMFIIPFGFISAGSTGVALLAEHFFHAPFTITVAVINISMFLAGYVMLGKRFAATTLMSTLIYPVFLELTSSLSKIVLTHDPLVATLCAGLLSGLALGLVIQSGASTGGLDIPPLILEKQTGIPVALSMGVADCLILLGQMVFSTKEGILCGLIFVAVVYLVMNRILTLGKSQLQVLIVSSRYEELRQALLVDLNRGVTLFEVETGYLHNNQKAVLSIISQKDYHAVQAKINEIDDQAFMIVSRVQEVRGLGFKPWNKK